MLCFNVGKLSTLVLVVQCTDSVYMCVGVDCQERRVAVVLGVLISSQLLYFVCHTRDLSKGSVSLKATFRGFWGANQARMR